MTENILDVSESCPNAFLQIIDTKVCNGTPEKPRLFCSDEAKDEEKDISMEYKTSDKVAYGFGFYAHVGLCEIPNKFLKVWSFAVWFQMRQDES